MSLVSCNVFPQKDTNSEKQSCEDAIASVERQLQERQLTVGISKKNNYNYPDHPKGRPDSYSFGIGGNTAASTISLDELLNSIATEIINSCDSISQVGFGVFQTDNLVNYGLMPNGKVEKFQCPADFAGYPSEREFKWGEFCSL